ncbi:hypothetical protein RYX36_006902, partial [Vicia faba]
YAGAILRANMSGPAFYGVSGSLSVYNPKIDKEQISFASMFIANQDSNNFDAISIGWHSDNFEKGCMNLQCYGFIQTDKSVIIGESFNQTSIIDESPVDISLAIVQQNSSTKDWWIYINEKKIGYYHVSLFSNMTSANQIVWIGKTANPRNTASPPMGYGVKPNGVFGHACHFKKLAFVNNSRMQQSLTKDMGEVKSTNGQCYDAQYYEDDTNGLTLQFGGPGGNNCVVNAGCLNLLFLSSFSSNYAGAILRANMSGPAFYGVSGSLSVYNPKIDKEQISFASMFIANQDSNNFDAISIGWHVAPSLYQDSKTHLYISWTSDNFEKGCMNLQCYGFIQTDKSVIIGESFNQTSIIDESPVDISLAIVQVISKLYD